ncbi:gliding motility-associated C-terminal domain-containing protein, partial [Chitinophagales bacterium]|nr:gliding motility-associated C-terminal domain-containing protein [Chitinophagales bacterium]
DFRSSLFVIHVEDITFASTCLTNIETEIDQIITDFGNDVNVFLLDENKEMDVRHELLSTPRLAVLDDGDHSDVHGDLLDEAQITYDSLSSQLFFQEYSCYTFISQPHLDVIENPQYIPSLTDFLQGGGNFFAHCISIKTFEDSGEFLTTNGVAIASAWQFSNNESYSYDFHDMPVMQYEGDLLPKLKGSLSSFELADNSNWEPFSYTTIQNQDNEYVMVAGDVNGANHGGNVFYLVGHDNNSKCYEDYLPPSPPESDLQQIWQFKRTYLNATLVPAGLNFACAGVQSCICKGDSVRLGCEILSDDLVGEFNWFPAEGLSCNNCPHPMASPENSTTYQMSSNDNCSSSSVTVLVIEPENISLTGGGQHCGEGVEASISYSRSENFSFQLLKNGVVIDTLTSSSSPFTFPLMESGDYSALCIDCPDEFSCGILSEGIIQVEEQLNTIPLNLPSELSICIGDSTIINTGLDSSYEFEWQDGSTDSFFSVNEAHGLPASSISTQDFWVIVTQDLCEKIDSTTLLTFSPPNLELGPDQFPCEGETVTLAVDLPEGYEATWQDSSSLISISVNESGAYAVSVKNEICELGDSVKITYRPKPGPIMGLDTVVCGPFEINYSAISEFATSYSWNTGENTNSILLDSIGEFTLLAANDCDTVEAVIRIEEDSDLIEELFFIPSAFSPDGNIFNDIFHPIPAHLELVTFYDFKVFNRWGNLVYESSQPNEGWDGLDESILAEVGVYLWYLKAIYTECGVVRNYEDQGHVSLIR